MLIQNGNGIPNHIAPKGTVYTDLDYAIEYINKDGISTWKQVIDGNYGTLLTQDQYNAITGSTTPSSTNVFATIADLNAGSGDTKQVKTSTTDLVPGFLNEKLTGSTNISLSILNSGGNELVQINQTGLATLTGATFTGNVNIPSISATTISATTFYGDGSQLSGISTDNFYTTASTLFNKIIYFNRNNGLSAYTADLSTLAYQSDLQSHTGDTSNPHNVTASQLGVYTTTQTDNKFVYKSGDTITGNLTINGDLFVVGTAHTANVEHFNVSANTITINKGEINSGITAGYGGLIIDRGTANPYIFEFQESSQTFRVGETGTTLAVASREDVPINKGIAYWDAATYKFNTTLNLSANTISATTFYGSGIGLTNVPYSAITNTPTDIYVSGVTYNNQNVLTFNSTGGQSALTATINTMTGLTINGGLSANTVSATTFYGSSSGLTGIVDTFVTGFTYTPNTFTISRNQGLSALTATINTMTGLTINGSLTVTGTTTLKTTTVNGNITVTGTTTSANISATTASASTLYITSTPATDTSTANILTRNATTGAIQKIDLTSSAVTANQILIQQNISGNGLLLSPIPTGYVIDSILLTETGGGNAGLINVSTTTGYTGDVLLQIPMNAYVKYYAGSDRLNADNCFFSDVAPQNLYISSTSWGSGAQITIRIFIKNFNI